MPGLAGAKRTKLRICIGGNKRDGKSCNSFNVILFIFGRQLFFLQFFQKPCFGFGCRRLLVPLLLPSSWPCMHAGNSDLCVALCLPNLNKSGYNSNNNRTTTMTTITNEYDDLTIRVATNSLEIAPAPHIRQLLGLPELW